MSGTHDQADGRRSPAPAGTVLAFDFGTRKIGVAIGNTLTGSARPLVTLRAESNAGRHAAIAALVDEWQPALLVVGRPLHADGTAHDTTALADKFARDLARRFRLPVEHVDERYTTQVAGFELSGAARGRGPAADRDAVAAQIILQAWLDTRPSSPQP